MWIARRVFEVGTVCPMNIISSFFKQVCEMSRCARVGCLYKIDEILIANSKEGDLRELCAKLKLRIPLLRFRASIMYRVL